MLCWNVYVSNFNGREIEPYNIFRHARFYDDCCKAKTKFNDDREGFAEAVRSDLMYYFWSKCEWEIILQHWPSMKDFHDKKIDVYDQVLLNWDVFIDYLWNNRKELKRRKPK